MVIKTQLNASNGHALPLAHIYISNDEDLCIDMAFSVASNGFESLTHHTHPKQAVNLCDM